MMTPPPLPLPKSADPNKVEVQEKFVESERIEEDGMMQSQSQSQSYAWWMRALPVAIHVLALAVYLVPLTRGALVRNPEATLDEMHIVSVENANVRGTSSLYDVFVNDYWGRPMMSESSHKSWRPLSVLTFRFFQGGGIFGWSDLFCHRLFNVCLHATLAELVSICSTRLFPSTCPYQFLTLRCLTKLLFCLHPTHVETVVNVANRPHILALLCSLLMLDPSVSIVLVILAQIAGLLSSETFIFQMPAVLLTMTVLQSKAGTSFSLRPAIKKLIPRYVLVVFLTGVYLGGRYAFDTLSIPEGLMRPAENPFYELQGRRRIMNYAYILSVHIGKSLLLDPIGFSHEYGFDCVPEIKGLDDLRLLGPLSIALGVVFSFVWCLCKKRGDGGVAEPLLFFLVACSWLATLFPVSGFVKVGTFIADRIVVASTTAFAMFAGRVLVGWLFSSFSPQQRNVEDPRFFATLGVKACLLGILLGWMGHKVHVRSSEWMTSYTLLESSLKTCPRSAKSNLEFSKIFSGLYPDKLDLNRARQLLKTAREIDPDYCDVDYQIAHISIQEGKTLEFEDALTKSLLCPFSMAGGLSLWQRYWEQVTSDPVAGPQAKQRMMKHQKVINDAVAKADQEDNGKGKIMPKQGSRHSSSRSSSNNAEL